MRPLRLTTEALADVQSAHDHYAAAKNDLGAAFVARVDEALHKVQRNPEMPQEILPGLRHVRLEKFDAYAVWYTCASEILILGCVHGKRNIPNVIRQRRNVLEP